MIIDNDTVLLVALGWLTYHFINEPIDNINTNTN